MTPLQKLREWIKQQRSTGSVLFNDDVVKKIEELMPEEREGLEDAYNAGGAIKNYNTGMDIEWLYISEQDYFTQKYGDNGSK